MKGMTLEMNLPNKLTLLRVILVPFFLLFLLVDQIPLHGLWALLIFAAASVTDALDGHIARSRGLITDFGKFLDPVADKVTQFTLTLCLSLKYPVLLPVLSLFVVKEGFQLIAGLFFWRKGRMLPGALMAGKVCTTVLFISLIALVLFPNMNPAAVNFIALVDSVFLFISFINYILAYFGRNKKDFSVWNSFRLSYLFWLL